MLRTPGIIIIVSYNYYYCFDCSILPQSIIELLAHFSYPSFLTLNVEKEMITYAVDTLLTFVISFSRDKKVRKHTWYRALSDAFPYSCKYRVLQYRIPNVLIFK